MHTLHREFDNIEKKRVQMYNEEESKQNKIMEDIVRLYTKVKQNDQVNQQNEKRIGLLNDKLTRIRQIV